MVLALAGLSTITKFFCITSVLRYFFLGLPDGGQTALIILFRAQKYVKLSHTPYIIVIFLDFLRFGIPQGTNIFRE